MEQRTGLLGRGPRSNDDRSPSVTSAPGRSFRGPRDQGDGKGTVARSSRTSHKRFAATHPAVDQAKMTLLAQDSSNAITGVETSE